MRDVLGAIEHRLDAVRTGVERRRSLADATPSIWPVAGWLTSAYGNRRDPFTGGSDFHPGLDISADRGDPVLAPATARRRWPAGTATTATWSSSTTATASSRSTVTCRASRVVNGQQVKRGDVIGYVGSTGRSTSPHLHYEIWVNGKLTNPAALLARVESGSAGPPVVTRRRPTARSAVSPRRRSTSKLVPAPNVDPSGSVPYNRLIP